MKFPVSGRKKRLLQKVLERWPNFEPENTREKVVFLEYERPIYDIFEKPNKTKLRFIHFLF